MDAAQARGRRALIINSGAATRLQPQLAVYGYETRTASTEGAAQAIEEFAPGVVLIELRQAGAGLDGDQDSLALARRLRAEPSTYALPLVFVFEEDERALRSAALNVGADDYFSVWIPAAEMLARLDALFWRAEAGRRAASAVGDQRLEIDNFILLLDAVRAAIRSGEGGTLALVYAAGGQGGPPDKAARDRTLAEAHGYLKLNLRRIDEVTFYGPTTLLVYLPRMDAVEGRAALQRVREQFGMERGPACDIAIGLASFPADGDEVESLIEKAEAAAEQARSQSGTERVMAYRATEAPVDSRQLSARAQATPAAANPPTGSHTPAHAPSARDEDSRPVAPPSFSPRPETAPAGQAARYDEGLADQWRAHEKGAAEKAEVKRTAEPAYEKADEKRLAEKTDERNAGESINPVLPSFEARPASASTADVPPASPSSSSASTGQGSYAQDRGVGAQQNGAEATKAAIEAAARERERRASGAIMPRRLLLTVSDAARMAQINALIRSAGYEARAAFDGQQALDLLRIERPDLLLLDYRLDGIDGVETLRRLRKQNGGRLKLPVVLLLPADHELARREALELGARAVVNTPYDPVELLTSVRLAGEVD